MSEATVVAVDYDDLPKVENLNQISLHDVVMKDFCAVIKGQPQGNPTKSPQTKKMLLVHQVLSRMLEATFDQEYYERFDYFFKEDIIFIFQGKKMKHHIIYSTKSKAYYVLFGGGYRQIKFGLLDNPPPSSQRRGNPQVNQDQVK